MEETSESISATQEELIRDEMEEISINEDAGDAEVIDTNTNVDLETIKKWRSLIVTDHSGNEHNKHLLVRSFFSSHGLQLARNAHSTDRIKRVRGESRYAQVDPNLANSNSVIQAFNIAEKISERSFSVGGLDSIEDELLNSCNNEDKIMIGDALMFLLEAKNLMSSSARTTKLVIGHAELFGKKGKKASYTHMPFEDRNDWHITASVEETIEAINCKGYPCVRLTSKKLACIENIDAFACVVVQPKVEIFHSDHLSSDFLEPQYSRVFEINDLEQIFHTLQSNNTSVPPKSKTIIPPIKINGEEKFILQTEIFELPQCSLCVPPCVIGDRNMKASLVERHLRNHTASHIAQEIGWANIEMPADPCGWCGGGDCSVKVNGKQKVTVTCKKIMNLPSFSLSSSKKKTKLFPSTNHPVQCGHCKDFVWSYNYIHHLKFGECGKHIALNDAQVVNHLPFMDEKDGSTTKLKTERYRLMKLFKINK